MGSEIYFVFSLSLSFEAPVGQKCCWAQKWSPCRGMARVANQTSWPGQTYIESIHLRKIHTTVTINIMPA